MAIFGTAQQLYDHFLPYMEQLVKDPAVGPKFVGANTSFRVNYSDPDAVMLLDATQEPAVNKVGDEARAASAEVDLFMSADDSHKFWMGDLNLPLALARKKVAIKGPVTKLLGMLPAITPAFGKYREYIKDNPVNAAEG